MKSFVTRATTVDQVPTTDLCAYIAGNEENDDVDFEVRVVSSTGNVFIASFQH